MKKINLKSVLLTAFAVSLSVFTYGQVDHSKMKMTHDKGGVMKQKEMAVMLNDANLNKAYMHYTIIKEAMFKGDAKKVQMMSDMLVSILHTYGKAADALNISVALAKADEIKAQRKLFADLTVAFEPLLKGNVTKGAIYKNFCPMANGSGSYWFSNSEKIVNPYFSGNMTGCGSVKETFKSI